MLTPIEEFLWAGRPLHGVVEIALSAKRLVLKLAPWKEIAGAAALEESAVVIAEFEDVKITSVDVSYCDAEDLNPPWDIIGFDCRQLPDGRWGFVLHTSGIEYGFDAKWPRLTNR